MTPDGLASHLAAWDDAQLVELVDERLGRLHRAPASFEDLASLLSQTPSCLNALPLLDRSAVQVLALLVASGGAATAGELAVTLGVEPALITDALQRAHRLALAWPTGSGTWRSTGGMRNLTRWALGRGPGYDELLDSLGMPELRELLRRLELGPARSRNHALSVLEHALPRRAVASLAEVSQDAVQVLLRLAVDGEIPEPGPPLDALLESALLLPVRGRLCLPAEVEELLRDGRPVLVVEREPVRQGVVRQPPPVQAALRLLDTCGRLIDLLVAEPPTALAAGGLGVQVLRRLAKGLQLEVEELVLLLQLLAAAGLVTTGAEAGRVSARGLAWRALPEEVAYVRLVRPQLHPQAVLEAPETSPSGLLMGVARSGRDRMTPRAAAAVAAGRGQESDASLVSYLDWSCWRPGPRATRLQQLAHPVAVLDVLALRVDGAPAPWLPPLLAADAGAASGPDDHVDDAEAEAAELLAAQLPPAQADVVLQADSTAVVAGRADSGLRVLLDLLGDRESEHTWRLSRAGVREALDAGRTGEDLLAELARRARHGVPPVVEQLVRDVAAAHGRIEVLSARTVLRLADPVLGVELLHDRALRPLGLVELSPGVLGSGKAPAEVVAALRAAGHAPTGDGTVAAKPKAASRRRTATRPSRPTWGISAEEVVSQLRRSSVAPALPDVPPDSADPGRRVLDQLWPRLRHLTHDQALLLVDAVLSGAPVEIDYVDSGGSPTTRVVQDLQVTGHLLVGHCRLRDDERMFAPLGVIGVRPAS